MHVQKMAYVEENSTPLHLTHTVTNDTMHRNYDNRNSTKVADSVLQNLLSLTCAAIEDSCVLPVAECTDKSSNISQPSSDNNIFAPPLLASAQNCNSSAVSMSSAAVSDNCTLPVTKSSVECSTPAVSSNDFLILPSGSSDCSSHAISNSSFPIFRQQMISDIETFDSPEACAAAMAARRKSRPRHQHSYSRYQCNYSRHQHHVTTQTEDQVYFETNKNTERQTQASRPKPFPRSITVHGRRLINFNYFFKTLKSVNNHSKYGCDLNDIFVKKEKVNGFFTSYELKCAVCKFETVIHSDPPLKSKRFNYRSFGLMIMSYNERFLLFIKRLFAMLQLPMSACDEFLKEYNDIMKEKRKRIEKMKMAIIQKNSGKSKYKEKSYQRLRKKSSGKNIKKIEEYTLSDSDNSLDEKMDHDDHLLIHDKFEIKEDVPENDHEPETILPLQTINADDNELVFSQEQIELNGAIIKQKVDLELHAAEEGPVKNNKEFENLSSKQPIEMRTSESTNQEQVLLEMITIKPEVSSYFGDEEFSYCKISDYQISNGVIDKEKQSEIIVSQQKETETNQNIEIDNQEKDNLHKSNKIDNIIENQIEDNRKLVGSESNTLGFMNKIDIHIHSDLLLVGEKNITNKDGVVAKQKHDKLDNREVRPVTSKEKSISQSNFNPNKNVASITCGDNVVGTSAEKTEKGSISAQHESTRYDALIVPQTDKDQGTISKVNYNKGKNSLPITGESPRSVIVYAVKSTPDAILKRRNYDKEGHMSDVHTDNSVPNIPVSSAGLEKVAFLAEDSVMAGTSNDSSASCKSCTIASPVSTPVEVINISDDSFDEGTLEPITPASQNSSCSKQLKSISMQVNSAFTPNSDEQYVASDAQVPWNFSDSQELMQHAESNYSVLNEPNSNLFMRGENPFQVPSMYYTTPFQAPQQYLPFQPPVDHWAPTTPSGVGNKNVKRKRRKKCGKCLGCQTKTNCGICGPCRNIRCHQVCKRRKCDTLKTKNNDESVPNFIYRNSFEQ